MPSLRQRMTTYFRQLSFIAEPREDASLSPRTTHDDGSFITKYLEGRMNKTILSGTEIYHGKEPIDLPDLVLKCYDTGSTTITAACTGPDEGLTGVKRSRLHLSAGPDIDFIDTNQDQDIDIRKSSSICKNKPNISKFKSDQNANKQFTRSRKFSKVQEQNIVTEIPEAHIEKSSTSLVSIPATSSKATTSEINKNILGKSVKHPDNINKNTTEDGPSLKKNKENLSPNDNVDDSNQNEFTVFNTIDIPDTIAGVTNWKLENDHAYGLSVSLYEKNIITNQQAGNPIADCYGMVVRGNSSAMALADGVNWGEGARLAARSAVQGSLEYLDTAVFGQVPGGMATTTREVFVSLLRSFWEAHACILEVGGALSTLTVAAILPLGGKYNDKYVVCSCNVGDSLGYVYSKRHGVKEFTQGSHDITSMRDMRDALGALGPVDGNKPELSNLTLSMTIVESGDIVFITSDGLSDNFDPVVGKFAEPFTTDSIKLPIQKEEIKPQLAPKRQNKSTSAIHSSGFRELPSNRFSLPPNQQTTSKSKLTLITPPIRPSRTKKSTPSTSMNTKTNENSIPNTTISNRQKFLRSHTVIEPRLNLSKTPVINFPKSATGLPLVTALQRQSLTLLRLEDLLCYGINGTMQPCSSARKLCHLLVDFVKLITSAKRKMLEQRELFYKVTTDHNGIKREVEMNRLQQRAARKRIVDSITFSSLPGKLDHASIVAFTINSDTRNTIKHINFAETDF